MIKISASFTKKVPGEEPYSSDGVHLGVEIELPDRVLSDPEQFSTTVRRLFQQARTEVEQQLEPGQPELSIIAHDHSSNGVGNGATNGNGRHPATVGRRNGQRSEPASKRQLDFLLSLARRNGNLSPKEVIEEAGVERLSDLSKNQASALIDRFGGGAGR